jgi:NAD(P)-dependent dehydrogenase (short-subunit alcohol dehydrogenase family)
MWQRLDAEWGPKLGYMPGEFYRQRVEKIPLKRAGTVDEIAAIATFLCSDEGDYITGQTYNVDGGSELN